MVVSVRGLLAGLALVGTSLALSSPEITAASGEARTLSIYNIHTKETLSVLYKKDGQHIPSALKKINAVMRDWRKNEETEIDPKLVDIMWEMHDELGSKEPIHLISGYRSRATNDGLRESVGGQAKNSRHILGKAADIHFPDVPVKRLRYSALVRERGGVGYYPTSALPFVHVDTDRVRHWPPMPRYELALLFPDGHSKHVPADGKPIGKEDVRIAQARYKDVAIQVAEFHDIRQKPDASRTQVAAAAPLQVPAPRLVERPQLASLTPPAGQPIRPEAVRTALKQDAPTTPAAAAAATPPTAPAMPAVAPVVAKAAAAPAPDLLAALMKREVASLEARERKQRTEAEVTAKGQALGAKADAAARIAAVVPSAGALPASATTLAAAKPERLTSEALRSWSNGYAQAPEFDEEHPEELSYRPFSIGPVITAHIGNDHPVLARMQAPDTGRVFDLLEETERLFPLSFRPGRQMAELEMAAQFNGERVGPEQLARLRGQGSGSVLRQRQVPTVLQR